jgi:hypothetical protein
VWNGGKVGSLGGEVGSHADLCGRNMWVEERAGAKSLGQEPMPGLNCWLGGSEDKVRSKRSST